jgi:Na+-driven multidrug efflux pump
MERIPSYKEIFRIAIPIMVGGISESISAIVDTAFMGRIGTLAMDGMVWLIFSY